MVGLSRSRIYQLIGSGELRSIKVGRRRLVPMSAISELLGDDESSRGAQRRGEAV
jgi:excisionase family DNA binding protein